MNFESENFYHVYNRSYRKNLLFFKPANYTYFLKKIAGLCAYCEVLAYCLMPNHFHLLLYLAEQSSGIARFAADSGVAGMQTLVRKIGTIQSSYTQAINNQEKRTGSLFQPKCKAKELEGRDQAFTCFNYIHRNPVKAALVPKIEDWRYSSFNEYYRGYDGICNKEMARKLLNIPVDRNLFYSESCGAD